MTEKIPGILPPGLNSYLKIVKAFQIFAPKNNLNMDKKLWKWNIGITINSAPHEADW